MRKLPTLVTLLALISVGISEPAFAVIKTGTTGGAEQNDMTLKGGVSDVEVTLNDLRDARLSSSRVRKAAADLYDEMTRQEMTMRMNPNVVGSTVIMTQMPMPTGRLLPARKKWVDESMSVIGPIIKLFKEDVDKAIEDDQRTGSEGAIHKSLSTIKDELFGLVNDSFKNLGDLEGLTHGPTYDNKSVANLSKELDSNMKKLDRSLKRGISILQKEAKSARKQKKSESK